MKAILATAHGLFTLCPENEWRPYETRSAIPDHADALAGILEKAARELRGNRSAEDVANELLPIVRVATRRT